MSLLLSNRQIYTEARKIAYGHASGTIEVSTSRRYKNELPGQLRYMLDLSIEPLTSYAVSNIKDWQLHLQFCCPYSDSYPDYVHAMGATSTFVMDRLLNGEGVLEAVAELVKIEDLETLKVKFPCTCQTYRVGGGIVAGRFRPPTSETEFQSILKVLEPLKALNIQKSVMFIAARPCIGKGDDSRHLWWQTLNTQCQKPACRAFAARFRALKDFL